VLAPPGDAQPVAKYAPFYVANADAPHLAVLPDGERRPIPALPVTQALAEVPDPPLPSAPEGPTRRTPLGTAFGARSGDKGGDCNVGVWAASDVGYAWLAQHLTPERVRELLPETAELEIRRTLLPNLCAVNLVLVGLLGEGVSSAYRFDPQGKAVGEWLRSRFVDLPEELLS